MVLSYIYIFICIISRQQFGALVSTYFNIFKMASGGCEIREFLKKNNLSHYFDNFIEQGYDDIDQILSMASNPIELNSLMKDVAMPDTKKGLLWLSKYWPRKLSTRDY